MLHQPFTRFSCGLLPLLALGLYACGNAGNGAGTAADSSTATSTVATPVDHTPVTGDFCKRYEGTLAGKPVVAWLVRCQQSVRGYYQYTGIGQAIALNNYEDTVAGDDRYYLSEQATGIQPSGVPPHWDVRFAGNRVEGEWRWGDGSRHYDLRLTEAMPPGSVPLTVLFVQDSAALAPGKPGSPQAVATAQTLQATGQDAFFVNGHIARLTGGRAGDDLRAGIQMGQQVFFTEYKKDNAESAGDSQIAYAMNWTQDESLAVVSNDSGLLVLEYIAATYTGGAHGGASCSYANIDLRERRTWALADVIADTGRLSPLLDAPARQYMGTTDKKQSLTDVGYFVRKIPATGNFYITPGGITFVYGEYEIGAYALGIIPLYVPYKSLMPLLTPEFKKRMSL